MIRSLQEQVRKLDTLSVFKYTLTAMFLFLPLLGIYEATTGLLNGPNYFGVRQVLLEDVDFYRYQSSSGGRFGRSTEEEGIYISYSFEGNDGNQHKGEMTFSPHNLPVSRYRLQKGQSLFMRVPVPKAEGSFGINRQTEQGLALGGFFGLLAWPLLLLIHSNGSEGRRQTGLFLVKAIHVVIILYLIYVVIE